jgi:hypothetical protein
MVFLKKRFNLLQVCSWKFLEKPFEPSWMDGPQQNTRLHANVQEGMHRIFGDEHKRPNRGTCDAVAKLEVKLSLHDIEKLIFRAMDVEGWAIRQNARIPPDSKRTARLCISGEDVGSVFLASNGTQEMGGAIGEHHESLFLMRDGY